MLALRPGPHIQLDALQWLLATLRDEGAADAKQGNAGGREGGAREGGVGGEGRDGGGHANNAGGRDRSAERSGNAGDASGAAQAEGNGERDSAGRDATAVDAPSSDATTLATQAHPSHNHPPPRSPLCDVLLRQLLDCLSSPYAHVSSAALAGLGKVVAARPLTPLQLPEVAACLATLLTHPSGRVRAKAADILVSVSPYAAACAAHPR